MIHDRASASVVSGNGCIVVVVKHHIIIIIIIIIGMENRCAISYFDYLQWLSAPNLEIFPPLYEKYYPTTNKRGKCRDNDI